MAGATCMLTSQNRLRGLADDLWRPCRIKQFVNIEILKYSNKNPLNFLTTDNKAYFNRKKHDLRYSI